MRRYSGSTTASYSIKKGTILTNLQALPLAGGGSVAGIPDGHGGSITMTLPDGSNGFNLDPKHVNIVFAADTTLTFTSCSTYYFEIINKDGNWP